MLFIIIFCTCILIKTLGTYSLICVSKKSKMYMRTAGTTAAPATQRGTGAINPRGEMSQPRSLGLEGDRPWGTFSFSVYVPGCTESSTTIRIIAIGTPKSPRVLLTCTVIIIQFLANIKYLLIYIEVHQFGKVTFTSR